MLPQAPRDTEQATHKPWSKTAEAGMMEFQYAPLTTD
ncbi:hypothetical protein THICB2_510018 [Thiomonas sp. CB2]|nr:hypothetical protein THICB2_510018 [Thiomonas sp. CB2]VDY18218.1 protein of unknown function [Thiomonas sp. CB2]